MRPSPSGDINEPVQVDRPVVILMISGSLRSGSVTTAVLRAAAELLPPRVIADAFDGTGLLPHYNPDDDVDPLHPAVADYPQRIVAADAVLFSTPEYAGALPGAFKNALDWIVGGTGTEITGKPVAWINPSTGPTGPTGAADAYDSLRKVFRFIQPRIIEGACTQIPVFRRQITVDGEIPDRMIRETIARSVAILVEATWVERASGPDDTTTRHNESRGPRSRSTGGAAPLSGHL